jgi:hypothetical protein
MKTLHALLLAALLALPLSARATDDEDKFFRHMLTLVQTFTSIAAQSATPERDIVEVLSGKNPQANQAASGLLQEITADMSPQTRTQMSAIGADLLSIARRSATPFSAPAQASATDPVQARKDLTSMGLKYHDSGDFLDAVKRNDALAVELFIAGKGVNLGATDWRGRNAAEIARANGNERLATLLSSRLP